jgi:hypothetical protein
MNENSQHTVFIRNGLELDKGCWETGTRGGTSGGTSGGTRGVTATLFAQYDQSDESGRGDLHGAMVDAAKTKATKTSKQALPRVTLTGKILPLSPTDPSLPRLRALYSVKHSYASTVLDSPLFSFYKLLPIDVYYVGGYGVDSKWIDSNSYKSAIPDVLATSSNAIVHKLNERYYDDIVSVVNHVFNVDNVINAVVTTVDRLGFQVRVTSGDDSIGSGSGSGSVSNSGVGNNFRTYTAEYRIGFPFTNVGNVKDAKSEVMKVFQEAWEKGEGMLEGEDVCFSWAKVQKDGLSGRG